jgi:hypothetical protein
VPGCPEHAPSLHVPQGAERHAAQRDGTGAAAEATGPRSLVKIADPLIVGGEPGEQATMLYLDPSGNAVEIKGCADIGSLFAK